MAILVRILSKQVCQSSHLFRTYNSSSLKLQTTTVIITSPPSSIVSSSRLLFSSSSLFPPTDSSSSSSGGSSGGSSNDDIVIAIANPTITPPATSNSSSSKSSSSRNSNYSRPFRILGLQQIAIGSLTKGPVLHLWTNILGIPKIGSYININENVDEDILLLGGGGGGGVVDDESGGSSSSSSKNNNNTTTAIEIDLMIPLDPTKTPKVHIPPLNHIGLWVDDLYSAVTWMTAHGVRFTPGGIRLGASGYNVIFIHPKGNTEYPIGGENVLIELVQAPSHVIEAFTTHLPSVKQT